MVTLHAVLSNDAQTTLPDTAIEDFRSRMRGDVLTPDAEAVRQHHAALGVPCSDVHQVDSLL